MWEYRWVQATTNSDDATLPGLGAEGWEAVGFTSMGTSLGKTWVQVLLKRATAAPARSADPAVTAMQERPQAQPVPALQSVTVP